MEIRLYNHPESFGLIRNLKSSAFPTPFVAFIFLSICTSLDSIAIAHSLHPRSMDVPHFFICMYIGSCDHDHMLLRPMYMESYIYAPPPAASIEKLVTLRATVVRVGSISSLITGMAFRCLKCGEMTSQAFEDGKFTFPSRCQGDDCK